MFIIYSPELQSWKVISGNIEGTDFYVNDLFVTIDGNIWGSTAGNYYKGNPILEDRVPVLSKYNEHTEEFEFSSGAFEVNIVKPDDTKLAWAPYFSHIDVVLDTKEDVFWIFVKDDGIYRYDPVMQITHKWVEIDLEMFFDPVSSPDGSIFVDDFSPEKNIEPYFHIYDGALLQFFPDTKEIVPLDIPDEPWPWFSGWLVSSADELWLGAIGFQDEGKSWQLLHPDTENYFKNIANPTWATPYLMMESSNGLLWYQKNLDMGINHEGTAWYDPQTERGCMVTNIATNLVEDTNQALWLVADGKLYKYQLEP